MYTQVMVRDELVFRVGRPPVEFVLDIPNDHITIRELIRTRVEQEVAAFNEQQTEYFQGLIQPTAAELTLNGYRMPHRQRVDPVEQVERALAAFEHNGFVVLVDDGQVECLDDEAVLGSASVVTFLKLVPLVGAKAMQHTQDDRIADLLTAWAGGVYRYDAQLKDFPAGQKLLSASLEEQRRFVMAAVAWSQVPRNNNSSIWMVLHALSALLRRALPFEQNDLLTLLRWAQSDVFEWHIEPHLSKIVEPYLATHPRTPALDTALLKLVEALEERAWSADRRRRLIRLKELAGLTQSDMPLLVGDVWTDTASPRISFASTSSTRSARRAAGRTSCG